MSAPSAEALRAEDQRARDAANAQDRYTFRAAFSTLPNRC